MAVQTAAAQRHETFAHLLRAHALVVRQLSQELVAEHDLTISDYEVLLRLWRAPDHTLRRVDLAEQVLLSPSGITRLLEGLERAGFVARKSCAEDARVVYARLTPAGVEKLERCRKLHWAGVERLFLAHFDDDELATLGALLARVSADDEPACAE